MQNKIFQDKLELAIVNYQLAVEENDDKLTKKYYDVICEVYPPLDFLNVWYKKYKHLYETREDFTQEYLYVFLKNIIFILLIHIKKKSAKQINYNIDFDSNAQRNYL